MRISIFCFYIFLAGCSHPTHTFLGTWATPDGSRLEIGAHDATIVNAAKHQHFTMHYIQRSPTELALTNEKGKVAILCTLSDDGDSVQIFAQRPFGTGTYLLQRVP